MKEISPAYWIAGAIAAVVLSTIMIAAVSRQQLIPAILLWLALPEVIYIAVVVYQSVTRDAPSYPASNFIFGFMLTFIITIIPWLAVSGVGFGVGFVVRRLVR